MVKLGHITHVMVPMATGQMGRDVAQRFGADMIFFVHPS